MAVLLLTCERVDAQLRRCAICGGTMDGRGNRARYCSETCINRGTYLRALARTDRPEVRCEVCGTDFQMSISAALRNGKSGRFCSSKCTHACKRLYDSHAEKKRAENARYRVREGLLPLPLKTTLLCRICCKPFKQVICTQQICSRECRIIEDRNRTAKKKKLRHARDRSPRSCKECNQPFAPEYGDKRRIFCSSACSNKQFRRTAKSARRHRKRGIAAERVNPIEVFERDGWRCHLCHKRTPQRYRGTMKPRAPELDHIISLADGGAHSRSNTACACRECNGRKGAASRGQPSLLAALQP